jgi:hypothetical protein
MRFQPKRRASSDHKPGPNMATAPAMVASKRTTQTSPRSVSICQISMKAANAPTIGVQRPGMRRTPQTASNADVIVALIGGSLHKVRPARTINAEPPTRRMRSNPVPGQPPAKVEYKRRNTHPFVRTRVSHCDVRRYPKESRNRHSFGFGMQAGEVVGRRGLQFDDSSLQADHRGVGSIVGAQFGKNALDSAFDRFLGDRKLIRNLLVCISCRDQSQNIDFRRR